MKSLYQISNAILKQGQLAVRKEIRGQRLNELVHFKMRAVFHPIHHWRFQVQLLALDELACGAGQEGMPIGFAKDWQELVFAADEQLDEMYRSQVYVNPKPELKPCASAMSST